MFYSTILFHFNDGGEQDGFLRCQLDAGRCSHPWVHEFARDAVRDTTRGSQVADNFLSVGEALKGIKNRSRDMIESLDSKCAVLPRSEGSPSHEPAVLTANRAVIMFASHGSFGVVDPGLLRRILAVIIC